MIPRHVLSRVAVTFAGASLAAGLGKQTWDFENDEPGKIASGFTSEVGRWEVAAAGAGLWSRADAQSYFDDLTASD
jgi:hypothetical protein